MRKIKKGINKYYAISVLTIGSAFMGFAFTFCIITIPCAVISIQIFGQIDSNFFSEVFLPIWFISTIFFIIFCLYGDI